MRRFRSLQVSADDLSTDDESCNAIFFLTEVNAISEGVAMRSRADGPTPDLPLCGGKRPPEEELTSAEALPLTLPETTMVFNLIKFNDFIISLAFFVGLISWLRKFEKLENSKNSKIQKLENLKGKLKQLKGKLKQFLIEKIGKNWKN